MRDVQLLLHVSVILYLILFVRVFSLHSKQHYAGWHDVALFKFLNLRLPSWTALWTWTDNETMRSRVRTYKRAPPLLLHRTQIERDEKQQMMHVEQETSFISL